MRVKKLPAAEGRREHGELHLRLHEVPDREPAPTIAAWPEFEAVEVARACGKAVWKPLMEEIKATTHRD